jgi:hypothetical protein
MSHDHIRRGILHPLLGVKAPKVFNPAGNATFQERLLQARRGLEAKEAVRTARATEKPLEKRGKRMPSTTITVIRDRFREK